MGRSTLFLGCLGSAHVNPWASECPLLTFRGLRPQCHSSAQKGDIRHLLGNDRFRPKAAGLQCAAFRSLGSP